MHDKEAQTAVDFFGPPEEPVVLKMLNIFEHMWKAWTWRQ